MCKLYTILLHAVGYYLTDGEIHEIKEYLRKLKSSPEKPSAGITISIHMYDCYKVTLTCYYLVFLNQMLLSF